MKEKIKVFLLIIMCLVYMAVICKFAHNKWINGLSQEEIMKEERIIW